MFRLGEFRQTESCHMSVAGNTALRQLPAVNEKLRKQRHERRPMAGRRMGTDV
jgi:hypothetical protein